MSKKGKNWSLRIVSVIVMYIMLSLGVYADCPIPDFEKVISFCTEDNEMGITYPASLESGNIQFFLDRDENGQLMHNTGCLDVYVSPVWYAMQIDHDGSMIIEMSHSELGDLDFACYGPFDGSSKNEMLSKVCSNPALSFWTSWSYDRYCDEFFDEYQWNGEYSGDCRFRPENKYIYDSLLLYSNVLQNSKEIYDKCYEDYKEDICTLDEFSACSKSYVDVFSTYNEAIYNFQLIDPRYYDTTSNCFRPDVDPFPEGKMVDCCCSPNCKEICRIENAKHGEWYLLVLSNWSGREGDILFRKIGGEATTNCNVIVDASVNNSLCEGEDIRFNVNNVPSDATFEWTGPNGFSSDLRSPVIPNASKANEGTYSLRMTVGGKTSSAVDLDVTVGTPSVVDTTIRIQYGDTLDFAGDKLYAAGEYEHVFVTTAGCDSFVHLSLLVDTLDFDIVTENNGPLCEGETLVLSASHIPERTNIRWIGPNGFLSEDSLVSISNVLTDDGGTYRLEAVYLDIKKEVSPTFVMVYKNDTIDIYDQLTDSVFMFNDLAIKQPGVYTARLKNAHGCDSIVMLHLEWMSDSIRILPEPFFSPNGDGVKDRWFIDGVEKAPTAVKIYDRFGKAIRAYDAYSNEEGWDGKDANGHDMPSADYWYVVSVAKTDRLFVGHVALVR